MTFYLLISVAAFAPAPAVPRLSFRPVRTRTAPPVAADADAEAKILKLEAELKRLKAEAVEAELKALKAEAGMPAATTPAATPIREVVREAMAAAEERAAAAPPPPPPSPPPSEAPLLPSPEELGVDGQLCALVFYAEDGNNPKLEELLDAFEDEAAELAACGCALVGVRKAEETEKACGKEAEYKERFPSFNFVGGLEKLVEQRVALGLPREWGVLEERELYYDPVVVLLTAEGRMQYTVSHAGLRAPYMVGNLMRELHGLVPTGAQLSRAEEEAVRVAAYDENAAWAKVLEEDESLRQPTRSWFDATPRTSSRPLLAGVDAAALPEAIDEYLAAELGGAEEEEEEAPLYSKDGVKAPAWFARAKRLSEAGLNPKDSGGVYRLLFTPRGVNRPSRPRSGSGGTARRRPRRPARSLSGRRGSGWHRCASRARRRLPRRARASASCSAACCRRSMTSSARSSAPSRRAWRRSRSERGTALLPRVAGARAARATRRRRRCSARRCSHSAWNGPPPMRSRRGGCACCASCRRAWGRWRRRYSRDIVEISELQASVEELEAEGFADRQVLRKLKEQVRSSYASAPPEFIAEARKADLFNEYTPRRSLAEIAADVTSIVGAGLRAVERSVEETVAAPDYRSLPLNQRRRVAREPGNKIEIRKPRRRGEGE